MFDGAINSANTSDNLEYTLRLITDTRSSQQHTLPGCAAQSQATGALLRGLSPADPYNRLLLEVVQLLAHNLAVVCAATHQHLEASQSTKPAPSHTP